MSGLGPSLRAAATRAAAAAGATLAACLLGAVPALAQSSPTTATAAASSGSFHAGADPCSPASAGGPCTLTPARVTASWGGGLVASVSVQWATTGRPAGAPAPASTRTALSTSARGACKTVGGTTSCSWPWPGAMEDHGTVLNGTYQMQACVTATSSSCVASTFGPATVAVAAPPPSPASVSAQANGSSGATVTWAPVPVPDLAGYQVSRNGKPVWSCETASSAALRCPANPSWTDQPGAGLFAYQVTAVRYGASGATMVASPPASSAPVAVGLAALNSGSGGSLNLPVPPVAPVPVGSGSVGGAPGSAAGGSTTKRSGPGSAPTTDGGYSSTLPYGAANTLPGADQVSAPAEPGPRGPDVVPAASLALGALLVALAAHLLVLRQEATRQG